MQNNKVITFGEIMLRLSPPGFDRLVQAGQFDAVYGGSESNVAVSLENFGIPAGFVTCLPDSELGQCARNSLRTYGVDTESIVFSGGRLGLYYLEKGAGQRPSKVIYDRAGSAFSQSRPADYDWDNILKDACLFHYSGITPALGESVRAACRDGIRAAKAKHIPVCCDLNYRSKLWQPDAAGAVMSNFLKDTDILVANIEPARQLFGFSTDGTEITSGTVEGNGCIQTAEALSQSFGIGTVAVTLRGTLSAGRNNFGALLHTGGKDFFSPVYSIDIVDRVGGGDAFTAGLIYAVLKGFAPQKAVDFAVAAGTLKHSVNGDVNLVSAAEVEALMSGSDGRVQR